MVKNRRILTGFFILHFSMLALGIFSVRLPGRWLSSGQYAYGRVTGAGGSFGFFSPNVPRAINVEFDIETASGEITHTTLQQTAASEVQARLSNMIHMIEKNFKSEKVLRSLAASLTASIFRQYPDAKSVTFNAYFFSFPNMKNFDQGSRGQRHLLYSASFGRKS